MTSVDLCLPYHCFKNGHISFIENKGLSGGPLGNCGENPSSSSVPPLKSVTTSRGGHGFWTNRCCQKLASNRDGNPIENSFRAAILTLGKIRHHNIVKLYGSCYYQGSNLLIYEYLERGSLGELLHGSSCNLEWPTWFHVVVGAAEGLTYPHHDCKPRIIHCDIKSNNILLYKNFEAHVGAFGLAKVIEMPQFKSLSAFVDSTTCNHILNAS
ncbi:hypothetical protein LWI28_013275 [Acer negundo]|uniref:Protein kinase domain-containing protein n=1 Tax=Acer negundo TaxID=4023 RepID=A0AAD5JJD6_ACENE|nr:hypothetical protein LWI28_013275 [Acer negundo]KAK4854905.1 hypothetical protein QYF36_002344 [Acer negundo]